MAKCLDPFILLPSKCFLQHLNYSDILKSCLVSKTWNQSIGMSESCMKKLQINFCGNAIIEIIEAFIGSTRNYQNFKIKCNNEESADHCIAILKKFERFIIELKVIQASWYWDLINTSKFEDKVFIFTNLKRLEISSANDYASEILFISCTYLESLKLSNLHLSKYFYYCLRTNEKLKVLEITDPIWFTEMDSKDSFNFKLHHFEFHYCEEKTNCSSIYDGFVHPLLESQLKFLKSFSIDGANYKTLNLVLNEMGHGKFTWLKIGIYEEILELKMTDCDVRIMEFKENDHLKIITSLRKFLRVQTLNLEWIKLSGVHNDLINLILNEGKPSRFITFGTTGNFNFKSMDEIVSIETTATILNDLKSIIKMAPKMKRLRVFEVTKPLMDIINEKINLTSIEFHFINMDCIKTDKHLKHVTSLDPIMRIPEELHDLVFQHMDNREITELTKTWTTFYFK